MTMDEYNQWKAEKFEKDCKSTQRKDAKERAKKQKKVLILLNKLF